MGQKTYLEGMEFEGNELSLVHHPTGFIRKLNIPAHVSGVQRGNVKAQTITSTQKIGDGKYEATQHVQLLPGFEATAQDKFTATIQSVPTYQWQYTLSDHLGNQRALFTDKNGDGLLRQSADESLNEVLALRNYSAFGLELGGSNQNINYQNAYKYTGKEENSFTGYYDFGARWSDPSVGNRFLQIDYFAERYANFSTYSYAINNPLSFIDPNGMEVIEIEGGTRYTGDDAKAKFKELKSNAPTIVLENPVLNGPTGGGTTPTNSSLLVSWVGRALGTLGLVLFPLEAGPKHEFTAKLAKPEEDRFSELEAKRSKELAHGRDLLGAEWTEYWELYNKKYPVPSLRTRNGHLANQEHPTTGVPFDKDGFPDFSNYLYKGGVSDVTIKPTGTNAGDFAAANKMAGYKSTPKGYTWHHHQTTGRIQLVEYNIHRKTGHTGGASLWYK